LTPAYTRQRYEPHPTDPSLLVVVTDAYYEIVSPCPWKHRFWTREPEKWIGWHGCFAKYCPYYRGEPTMDPDKSDRDYWLGIMFKYDHLPEHLQAVSKPFAVTAEHILTQYRCPERTAGLRHLMEAKDCAVRCEVVRKAQGG
jgi:hypothetical protein